MTAFANKFANKLLVFHLVGFRTHFETQAESKHILWWNLCTLSLKSNTGWYNNSVSGRLNWPQIDARKWQISSPILSVSSSPEVNLVMELPRKWGQFFSPFFAAKSVPPVAVPINRNLPDVVPCTTDRSPPKSTSDKVSLFIKSAHSARYTFVWIFMYDSTKEKTQQQQQHLECPCILVRKLIRAN